MPKNLVPNHFDYAGIYVEGQRSGFRFHKPVLTACMSGMLTPFGSPIPVFPGVKLDLQLDATVRTNTMVVPPLDGIYIDFISVWVPHRIVWNHMPQFLGENDTTAWTQSSTYVYPSVTLDTFNDSLHTLLSGSATDESVSAANLFLAPHYGLYYGQSLVDSNNTALPSASLAINVLAMRGYYALWNHLFRDENYQRPVLFDKGDTGSAGEFGYFLRPYKFTASADVETEIGTLGDGQQAEYAALMPVNKFHDAFTSVLPEPQFGDAVQLPLGDFAPIVTNGTTLHSVLTDSSNSPIMFGNNSNVAFSNNRFLGAYSGKLGTSSQTDPMVAIGNANEYAESTNMVADLSNATAATINQFRTSVMYQRYLEALARGGRRVPEYYDTIYGVKNSTAGKDYPELIARSRYLLGVNQVVATADNGSGDGSWSSHLGDTGAYSLTNLRNIPCAQKDFTEFGYLHVLMCVRSGNRYSTMVEPHFLRSSLLDEYNPYFDHIGDVAVPNTVVNVLAATSGNFGYQEAWWDERTQVAMAIGPMNKQYGSLKYWTLGETFDSTLVTCTPAYLTFDPAVLDDVFVSAYYTYPQFIVDGLIRGRAVKRMSQHSIPGIVGRI